MQLKINNTDNIWHWKQIKTSFDLYLHYWRKGLSPSEELRQE